MKSDNYMLSGQANIGLTITLALIATLPAHAYLQGYVPSGLQGRVEPIRQKVLLDEIKNDSEYSALGLRILNNEDGLFIKGKDASGAAWTVKTDYAGLGGSAYSGDVDGNGEEDLMILAGTGACGIAPPSRLLIVLFDKKKRPHPYETVGYMWHPHKGIQDVVRVKGIAGGVILQQDLTYVSGVTRDRSYWRWHAYQARDAQIKPLTGVIGACAFPTFVWYTQKDNHKTSAMTAQLERTTRSQQNDAWTEMDVESK